MNLIQSIAKYLPSQPKRLLTPFPLVTPFSSSDPFFFFSALTFPEHCKIGVIDRSLHELVN
jgi:hypothetical protein